MGAPLALKKKTPSRTIRSPRRRGTLVGIRKHFFAGYFDAGIPTPNVCEKIKEFASVCTGSCTCPMACADMIRIPSFCAENGAPGWVLRFLSKSAEKVQNHRKSAEKDTGGELDAGKIQHAKRSL